MLGPVKMAGNSVTDEFLAVLDRDAAKPLGNVCKLQEPVAPGVKYSPRRVGWLPGRASARSTLRSRRHRGMAELGPGPKPASSRRRLQFLNSPGAARGRSDFFFANKSLTLARDDFNLNKINVMAEDIPNVPIGAVPPKKETGKVQPKKETVRINLPPKPSAAPTIKLPTLPPGGSAGAPVATGSASASAAAPVHAPGPPRTGAAAPTSTRAAPAATRAAPAPVAAVPSAVSPLDSILALAAAVVGLLAVGTVVYLLSLFTT